MDLLTKRLILGEPRPNGVGGYSKFYEVTVPRWGQPGPGAPQRCLFTPLVVGRRVGKKTFTIDNDKPKGPTTLEVVG